MSNLEQKHYYFVDPGVGEKVPGCPYTFFEDGRDVRSFIIPPSGYELTDFKLEPYPEDTFYDGKIVAQYEKAPFSNTLNLKVLKYLLGIVIIGILAVLYFFIFKNYHNPQPTFQSSLKPQDEITALPVDTLVQIQVADTSTTTEDASSEEIINEAFISDTIPTEVVVKEEVTIEEVAPFEKAAESKEKEIVEKSEPNPVATQEEQLTEVLTKEQFNEEFWNLIHNKESHMRSYGNLYRKYKSLNLKTRESYYLYLTILESTTAFSTWKNNLLNIPSDELKSIHSINALNEKLEEYK